MTHITNKLTAEHAVRVLASLLGGSPTEWDGILRADRHAPPEARTMPFTKSGRKIFYPSMGIASFVAASLDGGQDSGPGLGVGSAAGSSFGISARVVCDCTDEMFIEFEVPQNFHGESWISADAARTFASQLNFMADVCDEHERPKTDPELDALLEELGGPPARNEAIGPEAGIKEEITKENCK